MPAHVDAAGIHHEIVAPQRLRMLGGSAFQWPVKVYIGERKMLTASTLGLFAGCTFRSSSIARLNEKIATLMAPAACQLGREFVLANGVRL